MPFAQARQIFAISASPLMPSLTGPSPAHPISALPYEILQEIFIHCLPRYPLLQRQPSITTAPILLCHICSSWRRLAQASPSLWAHFSYALPVVAIQCPSSSRTYEFKERDITFVRWWKAKQGQIPPFLAFKVAQIDHGEKPTTSSNSAFLLEYLTSAQYLELDVFFWNWIHDDVLAVHPPVFPSLHTALAEHEHIYRGHPFYRLHTLLTAPSLRRLSLTVSFSDNTIVFPPQWSTLTHLSLRTSLSLLSWPTLIRAVPCLRWGHFDLTLGAPPYTLPRATPHPPQCTLPALMTLSIVIRSTLERSAVFPLSALFTGLHLPAVHTLALALPGARAWEDRRALHELYAVLACTPAVAQLALEDPLDTVAAQPATALDAPPTALPPLADVDPLWRRAPALARLHLALPARLSLHAAAREAFLALFVRALFAAECAWLDLRHAACPVRAVAVSNCAPFFHRTSVRTMARVRESAGAAPGVVLELLPGLVGPGAEEVSKEWRTRI